MSREDNFSVTVKIGSTDWGVWDKLSGGAIDSEELKYKPGAMAPAVSLGGSVNVENITVSRLFSRDVVQQKRKELYRAVGSALVTVTKQPLDGDRNPYGSPDVYTGILKTVTPPDADSESNDAALIAIEISSNGTIA